MALTQDIIDSIRDEIGDDDDFVNNDADLPGPSYSLGSLEGIYSSTSRGNEDVLRTALICWRRRLHSLQARSFDMTTEGSLFSRNQRIKFLERRVKELELLVDDTHRGLNLTVNTGLLKDGSANGGAEFS